MARDLSGQGTVHARDVSGTVVFLSGPRSKKRKGGEEKLFLIGSPSLRHCGLSTAAAAALRGAGEEANGGRDAFVGKRFTNSDPRVCAHTAGIGAVHGRGAMVCKPVAMQCTNAMRGGARRGKGGPVGGACVPNPW